VLTQRGPGRGAVQIQIGTPRVEPDGLREVGQGATVLPPLGEKAAAHPAKEGRPGLQADGLVEVRDGPFVVPLLLPGEPPQPVRTRILGVQAEGLGEIKDGVVVVRHAQEHGAPGAPGEGVRRVEADGLVEVPDGLVVFPAQGVRGPAAAVAQGVGRFEAKVLPGPDCLVLPFSCGLGGKGGFSDGCLGVPVCFSGELGRFGAAPGGTVGVFPDGQGIPQQADGHGEENEDEGNGTERARPIGHETPPLGKGKGKAGPCPGNPRPGDHRRGRETVTGLPQEKRSRS
jgi:hypothetical protein